LQSMAIQTRTRILISWRTAESGSPGETQGAP
jgi:hypothetical protein